MVYVIEVWYFRLISSTYSASDIRDLRILGNGPTGENSVSSKSVELNIPNTKVSIPNKAKKDNRSPVYTSDSQVINFKSNNLPGRSSSEERKKSRSYVQLNTKRMSPTLSNKHTDSGYINGFPSNRGQSGSNRSTPNEFDCEDIQSNRSQGESVRVYF